MPGHYNRNTINRRQFVNASLISAIALLSGCMTHRPTNPTRILFVCQAGTAKSAIAREIMRSRAKERGIVVNILSRGISIEDHISPELKQRLQADGIETRADPALPLTPVDWESADILVHFNPLPASVRHKDVRNWSDTPSVNDDYTNAKTTMDKRIDALLTEIAAKKR